MTCRDFRSLPVISDLETHSSIFIEGETRLVDGAVRDLTNLLRATPRAISSSLGVTANLENVSFYADGRTVKGRKARLGSDRQIEEYLGSHAATLCRSS